MLKEFKEFAMKGNVVDLAIGVIIGGAFGKIIDSLVNDIIMPIVAKIIGNVDFSNLFIPLSSAIKSTSLVEAKKEGAVLAWGNFATVTVNFLIIAFVLFMVVKAMNRLKRKAPPPVAETPRQELLLENIRDLLAKR